MQNGSYQLRHPSNCFIGHLRPAARRMVNCSSFPHAQCHERFTTENTLAGITRSQTWVMDQPSETSGAGAKSPSEN